MSASPRPRCKPLTTISELRNQVLSPLLYEGQRRRFEPLQLTVQNLTTEQFPVLRCVLPNNESVQLQLDDMSHKGNFAKFTDFVALLESSADARSLQLEKVKTLLSSKVAQSNLEGIWQLWHRAVFASQCDGRVLTVQHLLDALHSVLAPYIVQAESLMLMAGTYLILVVVGMVEPAVQNLVDFCESKSRGLNEQDNILADSYSKLGYELRNIHSLIVRFVSDKQYCRSSLLACQDLSVLRENLLQQHEDLSLPVQQDTANSLEQLVWDAQEGQPSDISLWLNVLELSLEGTLGSDEQRLLFMLSPVFQRSNRQTAVQSREFLQAQEVALDVLAMVAMVLDLSDRLLPAGHRDSPPAASSSQRRLLSAAGTSLSLIADHVRLLRLSQSSFLKDVLAAYGEAEAVAEEIERRKARLRIEEAEARADRAEMLCRELQLQAAAQRKLQRDVLRAQQHLVATWFSVVETQVDLSKAQRSCLEEANRQFRAATLVMTAPEVQDPLFSTEAPDSGASSPGTAPSPYLPIV